MLFYLPDKQSIIQVNTDPYHKIAETQDSYKFKTRSMHVRNKDEQLREVCKNNHIYIYEVNQLSEVKEIINKVTR